MSSVGLENLLRSSRFSERYCWFKSDKPLLLGGVEMSESPVQKPPSALHGGWLLSDPSTDA
jgi:hypothetical protein